MIKDFEIRRTELLDTLRERAHHNHVLVIGVPGVGKSHLLRKFTQELIDQKIDSFFLEADNFNVKSLNDLYKNMELPGSLSEALLDFESDKQSVFVLDGLDAARDDSTQRVFRELISDVQASCKNWNIVAGIRTFDALQSRELRLLFPKVKSENTLYTRPDVVQNHVVVEPLNDKEIIQAANDQRIKRLLHNPSLEFKELLRIPRNIEFALNLMKDGIDVGLLSGIQSEVQLINYIWEYYVLRGENRALKESVTREACKSMFSTKSLVVNKAQLMSFSDPSLSTAALNDLFSGYILEPARKHTDLIKFSNHTLFDYAVSRHIVPQTSTTDQVEFLKKKENSIFFRPSIRYFYSSQWFFDINGFWALLSAVSRSDEMAPTEQSLPFVTLVDESRSLNDVKKLLNPDTGTEKSIRYTLVSLNQLLRTDSLDPIWWIDFLKELVDRITPSNWGLLVDNLRWLDTEKRMDAIKTHPDLFSEFSRLSRRLLKRGWESGQESLAQVNSREVVQLVCKTYSDSVSESKAVLTQILDRLGESTTAVQEFYWLCNEIRSIIPLDPEFAAKIYKKGFSYEETSEETRNMGGYVLALQSNIRQDFEMSRYLLSKEFPFFLHTSPTQATRAMVDVVYAYYCNRERKSDESPIIEFEGVKFKRDLSSIWDSGDLYGDYGLQILREFERWLSTLSDQSAIKNAFDVLTESNVLAAVWRRALMAIHANPSNLSKAAVSILTNLPILLATDTHYEAAKALGKVFDLLESSDRAKVEATIENLSGYDASWEYNEEKLSEVLDRRRAEILTEISPDLLESVELKTLRDGLVQQGKLKATHKPFEMGPITSEPYSTKNWMKDEGVNLEDVHNSRLFQLADDLNTKIETLRAASLHEVAQLEKEIQDLWSLYVEEKESCTEHVRAFALTTMTDFANFVLRHKDFPINSEFGHILLNVVLTAAADKSPEYNPDCHEDFSQPSWSPAPRIESAQALIRLVSIHNQVSDEIINRIKQLALDEVPAVRFQIYRAALLLFKVSEATFWEIVEQALSSEKTLGVMKTVLSDLHSLVRDKRQQARLQHAAETVIKRVSNENLIQDLAEDAFSILAQLYILHGHQEAMAQLSPLFIGDLPNAKFVSKILDSSFGALLFGISHVYDKSTNPDGVRTRGLELILKSLEFVENQFQSLKENDYKERTAEVRQVYEVIDAVVNHFYFDADFGSEHQRATAIKLSAEERSRYFQVIALPLFQRVFEVCDPLKRGTFPAGSAQKFMELSLLFLPMNFKQTLRLVYKMLKASKKGGYLFDNFSIKSLTRLIDLLLADYRPNLRDDQEVLTMLSEILDDFVEIGWPEAVGLVLRLDKIFQ